VALCGQDIEQLPVARLDVDPVAPPLLADAPEICSGQRAGLEYAADAAESDGSPDSRALAWSDAREPHHTRIAGTNPSFTSMNTTLSESLSNTEKQTLTAR
jgi:hypothetical protein